MSIQYRSIRAFARAIPRVHSVLLGWFDRSDFPVATAPPWTSDDLAAVRRWAEDLQPDRAREDDNADVHTGNRYPLLEIESTCYTDRDDPAALIKSALAAPAPAVLPIEAAIIKGERTLSAREVRAYVAAAVQHRIAIFDSVLDCGRVAASAPSRVRAMMNDHAHADAELFREMLFGIFGADAIGTPPAGCDPRDTLEEDRLKILDHIDAFDRAEAKRKGKKTK